MLILGQKKVFWWYHNWFGTFRILLVLSIFLQNSLPFKARTNSWNELSHEANINLFPLFPFFYKNFYMILHFGYSEVVESFTSQKLWYAFEFWLFRICCCCHCESSQRWKLLFLPSSAQNPPPGCPHSALAALFAGLVITSQSTTQCTIPCTADRIVHNAPQRICSYTKVFLPLYLMTRMVESPSPNLVMGVRRTSYASGLISSVRL